MCPRNLCQAAKAFASREIQERTRARTTGAASFVAPDHTLRVPQQADTLSIVYPAYAVHDPNHVPSYRTNEAVSNLPSEIEAVLVVPGTESRYSGRLKLVQPTTAEVVGLDSSC